MPLSLTKAQKWVAIVAGLVAITSVVVTAAKTYVDVTAAASVAPVSAKLNEHALSPGHADELIELRRVREDLGYIRGQLDAHWGQLDNKDSHK